MDISPEQSFGIWARPMMKFHKREGKGKGNSPTLEWARQNYLDLTFRSTYFQLSVGKQFSWGRSFSWNYCLDRINQSQNRETLKNEVLPGRQPFKIAFFPICHVTYKAGSLPLWCNDEMLNLWCPVCSLAEKGWSFMTTNGYLKNFEHLWAPLESAQFALPVSFIFA